MLNLKLFFFLFFFLSNQAWVTTAPTVRMRCTLGSGDSTLRADPSWPRCRWKKKRREKGWAGWVCFSSDDDDDGDGGDDDGRDGGRDDGHDGDGDGDRASSGLQRRVTARQIGHACGITAAGQAGDAAAAAAAVMIVTATGRGARLSSGRRCRGYGGQLQLDQHHVVAHTLSEICPSASISAGRGKEPWMLNLPGRMPSHATLYKLLI
ncbi:hypothetical protein PUN28_009144 [Cardiocondyla obscurior]|uniref:Secreted protein n=1 Tax=Cardiocondyla obscurior TaxID=286306 RepID=A0AAW2FWG4_9HYME